MTTHADPTNRRGRRRLRVLLAVGAAAALLAPAAAMAGHGFSDVPKSNTFHGNIEWMADNGVTAGCGGTKYCPKDNVTREQMSAFMQRLAEKKIVDAKTAVTATTAITATTATTATTANNANNADKLDGLDSSAFLRTTGKAADADKLDGLDSSAFLRTTGKAADADKLDGLDSTFYTPVLAIDARYVGLDQVTNTPIATVTITTPAVGAVHVTNTSNWFDDVEFQVVTWTVPLAVGCASAGSSMPGSLSIAKDPANGSLALGGGGIVEGLAAGTHTFLMCTKIDSGSPLLNHVHLAATWYPASAVTRTPIGP